MSCKCKREVRVSSSCSCDQKSDDGCKVMVTCGAAVCTAIGVCVGGPAGGLFGAFASTLLGSMLCDNESEN